MKHLFMALIAISLTGCATSPYGTATSGGANYSYTKTADGCQITINSAREIAGANLQITKDCSVTVSAEQADGNQAMGVISELVGKIK